jgi:hypothetical protein
MHHDDDVRLQELLRAAFRDPAKARAGRDLWPRMLRRLEHVETRRPWLDWALGALAAAWLLAFPKVIPYLLYQL